jgi:hypothetical protein
MRKHHRAHTDVLVAGNATERPMVVAAAKVGLTRAAIEGEYTLSPIK